MFCIITIAIAAFFCLVIIGLDQTGLQENAKEKTVELAADLAARGPTIQNANEPFADLSRKHLETALQFYQSALADLQSKEFKNALDNAKNGLLNIELAIRLLDY